MQNATMVKSTIMWQHRLECACEEKPSSSILLHKIFAFELEIVAWFSHGGRWSNHTAQIFLTWPSVSSCVRHGCHRLEKFTAKR
jgi:hypothetical protein